LSKSNTQQAERLRQIYAQAHLFFVPSRAEAYGIVYCEAAALGLPVLARATGGVETIVQNGKTGVLLPPTAPISDYRDTILSLLRPNQPATAITPYTEMRQYARQRYEQVLNWDIFAQRVKNLLDSA
jgi:glycosyltransferase involved in cell wall biosynthesis